MKGILHLLIVGIISCAGSSDDDRATPPYPNHVALGGRATIAPGLAVSSGLIIGIAANADFSFESIMCGDPLLREGVEPLPCGPDCFKGSFLGEAITIDTVFAGCP